MTIVVWTLVAVALGYGTSASQEPAQESVDVKIENVPVLISLAGKSDSIRIVGILAETRAVRASIAGVLLEESGVSPAVGRELILVDICRVAESVGLRDLELCLKRPIFKHVIRGKSGDKGEFAFSGVPSNDYGLLVINKGPQVDSTMHAAPVVSDVKPRGSDVGAPMLRLQVGDDNTAASEAVHFRVRVRHR